MTMNDWTIEDAHRSVTHRGIELYAAIDYDEFYFRYGESILNYAIEDEDDWAYDYANAWFKEFPKFIDEILSGKSFKHTISDWTEGEDCWTYATEYKGISIQASIECDRHIEIRCNQSLTIMEDREEPYIEETMKAAERTINDLKSFIDYVKEHAK